MKISIQGEVAVEDVALARSLHRRGGLLWKAVAVVVALLATLVSIDTLTHSNRLNDMRMAAQFGAIALGGLASVFLFPRMWRPYEMPGFEVDRTVTDEGVFVQEETDTRFLPWEQITRAQTSDDVAIIYTRIAPTAYIFSRRWFLREDDWAKFRGLLASRTL